MNQSLDQWKRYRHKALSRMPMYLLVYPAGFGVVFSILGYLGRDETWSWSVDGADTFLTSCIIAWTIWAVYMLYFGVATALGSEWVRIARSNKRIMFVVSFVGLFAGLVLSEFVRAAVFHRAPDYSLGKTAFSLFVGGLIALGFLLHSDYRHFKRRAIELESATTEARYHTLKSQLQPHFLFNSLNSLSELISADPEKASVMTERLADLYRRILANSRAKTSSVASELSIAKDYLELERLRFGSRLFFEIDSRVDGEAVYLPSLMLQTLVENAVKHGIGPSVEGGRVAVSVVRSGSDALWYVMKVSNSGSPLRKPDSTPSSKSSGTGIVNTTQRLDLLYGARHGFRLETDPSGMTVASFEFSGERHE